MTIRFGAQHTGEGVLLTGITNLSDSQSLLAFLEERGVVVASGPLTTRGDCHIFLPHLTKDEFAKLVEGMNVELV